jgi:hypothetical protein
MMPTVATIAVTFALTLSPAHVDQPSSHELLMSYVQAIGGSDA